jgi:hypothetical protein
VVLSGTSAYSTTKTGRHDIAEILLKVVLNTKNQSISLVAIVLSVLRFTTSDYPVGIFKPLLTPMV